MENKIKELRLNGKSYDDIIEILPISRDELKKICRKLGLNKSSPHHRVTEELKKEMQEFYNLGNSLRETSKEFGFSRETIRSHIQTRKRKILTKEEKITSNSKNVTNWRRRRKEELVEYKGGKCEKCGYNKSIRALEFHHLDPTQKDFGIGGSNYSIERLKDEVDKCIMVCSNCHSEIHDELDC